MANVFQAVQTYQKASLGLLLNEMVFIPNMNTKFKEFNEDFAANLGATITHDLPPRFFARDTLIVNTFDSVEQRVGSLTVNQEANVNYAVTNEEQIFNMDPMDYMDEFGQGMVAELATKIESQIGESLVTNTFRFYGDGVTPINSFGQLALANAFYRNFGAPKKGNVKVFIDDISTANIVNTGLNQFTPARNDKLANSWELGSFNKADYFMSNLLPIHTAGTLGNDETELTVVSTNDATGANITQITFSGAGTDSDAVKENDLMWFIDNVSGQPNIRYRTFIGHKVSRCSVQVRLTADAVSSAGNVTVQIYPALSVTPGRNQNLSTNIVAGMKARIVPSHRRGAIIGGDAWYLGMPRLPNQTPFPTATKYDPESQVGLRMTYGAILGQNQMGIIYDGIWGDELVDEYAQALIIPL